jgi:hypothetical protein
MDTSWLSLVSACTALVASILGPIVTMAVAKRQFNANVLSANRQRWIEALRDMMAEVISLMVAVLVVKQQWKGEWNRGRGAIAADPKLLSKLERLVLVQWKVRLLVNPSEAEHAALVRRLDSALERLEREDVDEVATRADVDEITRLSQTILRHAWARVKQGT